MASEAARRANRKYAEANREKLKQRNLNFRLANPEKTILQGARGRACTSANMMLTKKHMSCIAGHQQGLQLATSYRADGERLTGIIAGSCYEHNEDYLGPQGNKHFRGMVMLHEVTPEGAFDVMPVSIKYLKENYL